ncbi:hypothetical protein QUF80_18025 [Desulfococcaceae bacterium HSG8]|nr:hypothetical protein [Desulfococcaceae bacterium HSG8]
MKKTSRQAIKTLVPEEVYTDRQEFIDYFYNYAISAVPRRAMSSVLLGHRRMGKTEIFKRVVNRLFYGQDHKDPAAVVPVWYSFRDEVTDRWDFSVRYAENFLRWYAGFRFRDPDIVSASSVRRQELPDFIKSNIDMTPGLTGALNIFQWLLERDVTIPEETALMLPRLVSDRDDSTIVMFLDEFQNTHLHNFRVVGYMQEAVESPTCSHFVTGSAMTILSKEILGRGALFGRFDSEPIKPLTQYWGAVLSLRAARHYRAELPEIMAPVLSDRCGGNPFYITAVIRQAAKKNEAIDSEKSLNSLLAVDLSSGFIWAELNDQVTRWIQRINEYGITKWVLYLSALGENDRISPEDIRKQLAEKEGTNVKIETVRDVLVMLSRGDLLEYMELGGWFRKTDDPILSDFLKVWGRIEVEGHSRPRVVTDIVRKYTRQERRIRDQKGYLAEVWLSQILWNGQGKTFPGRYFHSKADVTLPDRFYDMIHRLRLGASEKSEADIYASARDETWICESKWWETKKVGVNVVNDLIRLSEKVTEFEKKEYEAGNPVPVRCWLFAHNGVTGPAEKMLRKHDIFWSDRSDLDALIRETALTRLICRKVG